MYWMRWMGRRFWSSRIFEKSVRTLVSTKAISASYIAPFDEKLR